MENVDFPVLNHSGGTCGAIFCIFRQGTYTLQTRFSGFLTTFCLVRKRDIFWTKFQAQALGAPDDPILRSLCVVKRGGGGVSFFDLLSHSLSLCRDPKLKEFLLFRGQ